MCENKRTVDRRRPREDAGGLADYQTYRKMLRLSAESDAPAASERVVLQLRMREIERSLRAMPPCDARMLLELHYLQGLSVERCAEKLYVSRATAYRLKDRGLAQMRALDILPPAYT